MTTERQCEVCKRTEAKQWHLHRLFTPLGKRGAAMLVEVFYVCWACITRKGCRGCWPG